MKHRLVFIGLMFMQFLAGMAFYSWGLNTKPESNELLLCLMCGVLYLVAGVVCLTKWQMEE